MALNNAILANKYMVQVLWEIFGPVVKIAVFIIGVAILWSLVKVFLAAPLQTIVFIAFAFAVMFLFAWLFD